MLRRLSEPALLAILFGLVFFIPIQSARLPVFSGQFNSLDGSLYAVRLMDVLVAVSLSLFASRHLIPHKLDRQTVFKLVLWFGGILLVASAAEYGWDALMLRVFNLPTAPGEVSDKMLLTTSRETLKLTVFAGNLGILVAGIFYGLARERNSHIRRQEKLELENLEAEVKYLRSQLNPHFLFNALNNIYAITQRNQDKEGSDALLRLSGLMRYMLYDSAGERIGLDQELTHLRNFMDLMLLKYKKDDPPEIRVEVEGDPGQVQVAPLIFLPFVENAFKHGINNHGRGFIHMTLKASSQLIDFQLENSRYPDRVPSDQHKGIGLENVRRRLEHLYPERHNLDINQTEDRHTVRLRITR